jgi:hypothetical protein
MAKKILAIFTALVALAAIPAVASASPELQTSGGTKVAAGTAIKATNVGNTIFTTGFGNITCTHAEMTGHIHSNTGNHIEGTITTARFTGTHDGTTKCATTIFGVTMVEVTPENLHWCLTAGISPVHGITIRGGPCTGSALPLKFTLHTYNSSTTFTGSCTYERSTASGPITGSYVTNVSPLELTVTGGNTFTRVSGTTLCPSSGTLDAKFKVQTSTGGELKVV